MDSGLSGRVVIVTGAARGLGKEAAGAFAREGSLVAVVDADESGAGETADGLSGTAEALGIGADVSDEAQVEEVVRKVLHKWKRIDVLLHCAGIARGPGQMGTEGWIPMERVSLADWTRVLTVNLTGTFLMDRAVAPSMIEKRWGRIINVASISASVANRGVLGLGPYSASKGGVVSLTKVLAAEWAPYGITVNSISPGYMATEMGTRSQRFPGFKELQLSLSPQGRLGEPREFAHSAVFLASEGASHITGHDLKIDGGYTVW